VPAAPAPASTVASCAPTSAPFGIDGIWLANADSGCEARLNPGNQVFVELHVSPGYENWSPLLASDSRVLAEDAVFWSAPAGVTAGHYRAAGSGEATLTAYSRTSCTSDLTACQRHIRTWHVTITVTG
jgi:hypothetical protein